MRPKTNKQAATPLVQGNRLIRSGPYFYPKAIAGKTGYLALAKSNVVVAAKDNDRTLILVLLKVKERADLWKESIRLFEMAFQEPKVEKTFLSKGIQKTELRLASLAKPVKVHMNEDLVYSYYPAEEPKVRGLIHWQVKAPPVAEGDKVGEVKLIDTEGKLLASRDLFARESVGSTWKYWAQNSLMTFRGMAISLGALFSLGLVCFFFTARRL
jgi:D-alanyl-D-alanine carboxypeptidase (penicillin-binding protein 5/6)